MKKSIFYRGNAICNCDFCDKSFTECDVVKLADDLQKSYDFMLRVNYEANPFEHKITIDTFQTLPFLQKHLKDCADKCYKV